MRTTINLDDDLVHTAQELTGIAERTALVHQALRVLIEREAARRLALLHGSQPDMADVPRRRSEVAAPDVRSRRSG